MKLPKIRSPKGGVAVITGKGKHIYIPSPAYQQFKRKQEIKPVFAQGVLERRFELRVIQNGGLLPVHRETVKVFY